MSANSSRTSAEPIPNSAASTQSITGVRSGSTATKPKPATNIAIIPKKAWWTWTPPGVTFPGHQLTSARIIRTLNRMNRKVRTKARSRKNSGRRPVSTIRSSNHPVIPRP